MPTDSINILVVVYIHCCIVDYKLAFELNVNINIERLDQN